MSDTETSEDAQRTLIQIHQEAMKAANASWTETDKLYVSVCSALVALAAIFGRSSSASSSSLALVGVLVLLLSVNWMLLIKRYRRKILAALQGLATAQTDSTVRDYFTEEHKRFDGDRSDYYVAVVVLLLGLLMVVCPISCRLYGSLCV